MPFPPIEYPKIETLYDRDEKFKVRTSEVRMAEFELINLWRVTEKIDGMNIRVIWDANPQNLRFCGRTDNALLPAPLVSYLRKKFTEEMFLSFTDDVILFGEGYGPKIQNGGGYRSTPGFRLFDVRVGDWWLEPDSMNDIASQFNIVTVPSHGFIETLPRSADELRLITGNNSSTAHTDGGTGHQPEGIVARTIPLLLDRAGRRVMWKLKFKDFEIT